MRILRLTAPLVLLAGCAPYTWQHPGLDSAEAQRQFEIDSAECTATAMQAIPMPTAQTTVNVSFNGSEATSDDRGNDVFASDERVEQLRAERQAEQARYRLANACMLRRGWEQVRSS